MSGFIGKRRLRNNEVTPAKLSAALQDDIPQLTVVGINGADGTGSFLITVNDANGTTITGEGFLIRAWTSGRAGADLGAPVAVATDFSVAQGTEIDEITADADYRVLTSAGSIEMDVDDGQDGTLYCMAELDGRVYSGSVAITGT